jgi:hypothetical protein
MHFIQPNTSNDSLALLLTDKISHVSRCALIHGAATVGAVLRDVRRHIHVAQFGDELVGVITLVRTSVTR